MFIKTIDRASGSIVLRSRNRAYAPLEIDLRDESVHSRVIGRVLWWRREAR